jgi:predicted enzyme related to lactoylglutathione lyase
MDDVRMAKNSISLVLDCRDPQALAKFWAPALGYAEVGSVENYTLLVAEHDAGPRLLLQRVPEAKPAKNRMHLDLHTHDIDAEATRLEQLGARRTEAGARSEHGHGWIVMEDPDGNKFCVCDAVDDV